MDAATVIRRARQGAGLTQRELAARAGTSHPTLAAYESGRKTPGVDTLDRIVRAAGFGAEVELGRRADGDPAARLAKGRELVEALELAAMFPSRSKPRHLPPPVLRPRVPAPAG